MTKQFDICISLLYTICSDLHVHSYSQFVQFVFCNIALKGKKIMISSLMSHCKETHSLVCLANSNKSCRNKQNTHAHITSWHTWYLDLIAAWHWLISHCNSREPYVYGNLTPVLSGHWNGISSHDFKLPLTQRNQLVLLSTHKPMHRKAVCVQIFVNVF